MSVSVILPCAPAHLWSLPRALESLQAQRFAEWECLLVLDGVSSTGQDLARSFADRDPRIRPLILPTRQGRGAARLAAQLAARRDLLAGLDADDALDPHHLSALLLCLRAHPLLAAAACPLVVEDGAGQRQGVRGTPGLHRCRPGRPLATAFAAFMIRRDVAPRVRFNPRLQRAEDLHFLWRVLAHRRYAVLPRARYIYREEYSPEAMDVALQGFAYQRLVLEELRPPASLALFAANYARSLIYSVARRAGRGRYLFNRRTSSWTPRFRSQP